MCSSTRWFEDSILGGLPQYRMVKSMAEGFTTIESDASLQPALVFIDDVWQLAHRMEDLHDGWVAVFVLQSPTPMWGNLLFLEATRVRPLDMTMQEVLVPLKRMGTGSAAALSSISLSSQDRQPACAEAASRRTLSLPVQMLACRPCDPGFTEPRS